MTSSCNCCVVAFAAMSSSVALRKARTNNAHMFQWKKQNGSVGEGLHCQGQGEGLLIALACELFHDKGPESCGFHSATTCSQSSRIQRNGNPILRKGTACPGGDVRPSCTGSLRPRRRYYWIAYVWSMHVCRH